MTVGGVLISTFLGNFISSLVNGITKVGKYVGLYLLCCALLPFELAFPEEIVSIFSSGWFHDILVSIDFFVPVNFLLSCLVLILASKYTDILVSFFHKIIDWFRD